jgi:diguanylate cyclase (GGDEF)-like protein/PAS domain S-box-containing protein
MTGYKAEELVGRCCQDDILCHVDALGQNLCQQGCPLTASVIDGQVHEANVFLRHKQGGRVPVSVRVQPMRGANGSIVGAVEVFSKNSAFRETQRRIEAMERLALLDHLTQLPNRRYLEMSLRMALSEYEVHKDPLGLLLFDLDEFKQINDRLGHASGDGALRAVAKTLTGSLRPADTVGRWGGDEFLAIVRNVNEAVMKTTEERCVAQVAQTSFPGRDSASITLSVSVGSVLVRPGLCVDELLQQADESMYLDKAKGRIRRRSRSIEPGF